MKRRPIALWQSLICLLLCVSMLAGTTFAWFTDRVTTGVNTIAAGNLDVELYHSNAAVQNEQVKTDTILFKDLNGNPILWEPGVVSYENLRVTNEGDLALQYRLAMETANENFVVYPDGTLCGLSQILKVGVVEGGITATDRADVVAAVDAANWTSLANFLRTGNLLPAGKGESEKTWGVVVYWQPGDNDNLWNLNNGKQLDTGSVLSIDLGVKLVATQLTDESDSFGPDYDQNAAFPGVTGGSVSTQVPVENNIVTADTTLQGNGFKAFVPAGTKLADGATQLTFSVFEKDSSEANLTLDDQEEMYPLDVHIEGTAPDNDKPILVTIEKAMTIGLNIGNYKLYHVENGVANQMTAVAPAELDAHNEFTYDPATGDITLAMQTFSEVAMVAEEAKWEGGVDHSWYVGKSSPYQIANADQLWSFSQIVGGMNGQTRDSFAGKTVKLIANINLNDGEEANKSFIFYPIGYYNSEETYDRTGKAVDSTLKTFEGEFDGNGHTVSNFYHNTWEMKGDHNWYSPEAQYYRDGMGLFGRIYKGTVKNLTVKNFKSDGEIATTGVIAAYADGATFENIAIFDCNPRVYNIGNGGIVGCVGWYAKEANLKTTFYNITVDNSNKISALWGSYDVPCGGIVGQYYPTSGQTSAGTPENAGIHLENCHISAQMDVYNDVCANYQYYAYRYAGILIGSIRENTTNNDGKTIPDMTGISATGCTVHFGDWNDYYYCELVDNSTASYTHDYQMSRLTEIKAINGTTITNLDGTTGTVPASGRANYVIVDYAKGHGTENATCYHFKDGAVWTHDMGGIQTGIDENGDNQDDLKEDKQHIYLEFNNLVTGYGWGVTTMAVDDLEGVEILDREVANSVEKFTPVNSVNLSGIKNGDTVTINELFAENENAGVEIKNDSVMVSVTDLTNTGITADFTRGDTWDKGTLKFNGTNGLVTITIQDYFFCTPTTITVMVGEFKTTDRFAIKFPNTDKYLYRVGNKDGISVSSLFTAIDGQEANLGNIEIAVEATNSVSRSAIYTYTAGSSWNDGIIQFDKNFTGPVSVTIKDTNYSTPVVLCLEVINAKNATSAGQVVTESSDVVLLNNCTFTSLSVKNGYTLYGNGFTLTRSGDDVALDMGSGFVTLDNGILDNVQIVCPNFDYAVLYPSNRKDAGNHKETDAKGTERYGNVKSAVIASGNSRILNSRIAGGRAAVYVTNGNLIIDNSRIELGAAANIHVGSAVTDLALKNVTLVQKPTQANVHNTTKTLMGVSVIVMADSNGNTPPITIEGKLDQHAWAYEGYKEYVPDQGQSLVSTVLSKTNYIHSIKYAENSSYDSVNLGIIYMPDESASINKPTVTDTATSPYSFVTINSVAWVYTIGNEKIVNNLDVLTDMTAIPAYSATKQGEPLPILEFNDTNDSRQFTATYSAQKGWVYKLSVNLDNGGYKFNFADLKMKQAGFELDYTLPTGTATSIDVEEGTTEFTLTANDNTIYFQLIGTASSKEPPKWSNDANGTNLSDTMNASFADGVCVSTGNNKTWGGAAPALSNVYVRYYSTVAKTYKVINLADYTPTTKGTFDGNDTTCIIQGPDFTLTLTGGQVHSSNKVNAMPVVIQNNSNYSLYFVASASNGLVNSGNSARTVPVTYSFTDNLGNTLTGSHTWSVAEKKDGAYNYDTFCNGTLEENSCVTPDTLITLADGSQVRVDSLTGNEELLVWNMETGKLDSAPILFVDSDPEEEFEIIHLYFSDGTSVKVIYEHGFWDYTLNRYVYLDRNAQRYVGHLFAKQNGDTLTKVQLVAAVLEKEVTTAWSPVTADHLCYFVNGMLSMPGGVGGLFNIFAVDAKTMTYDYEAMQKDIETYGLFTYEELNAIAPLSEDMFNAAGGAYLKVSIGKGNLTMEELINMINRYSKYF